MSRLRLFIFPIFLATSSPAFGNPYDLTDHSGKYTCSPTAMGGVRFDREKKEWGSLGFNTDKDLFTFDVRDTGTQDEDDSGAIKRIYRIILVDKGAGGIPVRCESGSFWYPKDTAIGGDGIFSCTIATMKYLVDLKQKKLTFYFLGDYMTVAEDYKHDIAIGVGACKKSEN